MGLIKYSSYLIVADENIFLIILTRFWSTSDSRAFDGCCLVTTLSALQKPAFALGCDRTLHTRVLPILVTSVARF